MVECPRDKGKDVQCRHWGGLQCPDCHSEPHVFTSPVMTQNFWSEVQGLILNKETESEMNRHLSQALNLKDRLRQRMGGEGHRGRERKIMQRVEENEKKIIFSE